MIKSSMALHCNICSTNIDEKDVESHTSTSRHLENKSKISTNGKGLDKSVANMWHDSLK